MCLNIKFFQDKCVMTTSIICTCSLFLKSCFCLTDVLSMAKMINVFSKLKPVEGARVFWSGSVFDISLSADLTADPEITAAALLLQVYGECFVDQTGVIG
uniref:Uncharacterized protein n=1 Tax=Cyprinus carpio TaxID=7962 RepID=A0A8C2HZY0_CYPCA